MSIIETMEKAAREAAAFQLRELRSRGPGWGDSKAARDFVSYVDVESERMIRKTLEAALPDAAFYGEESEQTLGPLLTWIVDPLDGTTNYLSGYDHWAVSIALRGPAGMEAALVLKPAGDELFTAIEGGGAFRNGALLPRATALEPSGALIATGTPYRSRETMDAFFATTRRVMTACRDIRRTGSAALDLAYLSAGFFQGFWEIDLQPYDLAAGLLLLEETGHGYRNFAGGDYDPFRDRGIVAGRPGVLETLAEAVRAEYAAFM